MMFKTQHWELLRSLGYTDVYSVADWDDSVGFTGKKDGEKFLLRITSDGSVYQRRMLEKWALVKGNEPGTSVPV